MKQEAVLDQLPGLRVGVHQGLELRHLRYLIAVADADTFTQAAEQIFVAQPTLSQQIRRLEEMVGTPCCNAVATASGLHPQARCCWRSPGLSCP